MKAIAAKPDNLSSVFQPMWAKERTTTDKLSSDSQVCMGMYTYMSARAHMHAGHIQTHTQTESLNKYMLIFLKKDYFASKVDAGFTQSLQWVIKFCGYDSKEKLMHLEEGTEQPQKVNILGHLESMIVCCHWNVGNLMPGGFVYALAYSFQ